MSKINPCFKTIFVFFNILFAVFGLAVIALGVLVHVLLEEVENKLAGVIILYVTGGITFFVSVLGAYGAQKENKYVLITFFTIMCTGTVILFRIAVPMASSRTDFLLTVRDGFSHLVPLDHTSEDAQHAIMVFQKEFKCCGLFSGYQDWGEKVPDSCDCAYDEPDQCEQMVPVSVYSSIFQSRNRVVNKKPCGPIVMQYLDKIMTVVLGVLFGLTALALLAAVMSLVMIIYVSAFTQTPQPAFTLSYQPPKYSELENIQ